MPLLSLHFSFPLPYPSFPVPPYYYPLLLGYGERCKLVKCSLMTILIHAYADCH